MGRTLRPQHAAVRIVAAAASCVAIIVAIGWTEACTKRVKHVVAPIPDVSTIKIDPNYCEKNASRCEVLCAGCPDKAKCFKSGGECATGALGANTTIRDEQDRGPDIWLPGCHVQYPAAGCAGAGKTVWGDTCRDPVLIDEWFERACHADMGDHYIDDCNAKCKQLGLGAGKCVTDVGFCSGGINSAHCECEEGSPLPSPTPTVNP